MRQLEGYYIKKIGQNRGAPRVWLEGSQTSRAGFAPGQKYDIVVQGQTVVLQANPNGSRVVSWTQEQAIGYERACECIFDLIAVKQSDIYTEESMIYPCEEKIAGLCKDVSSLWCERDRLGVKDAAEIARIRTEYRAMIRAHRTNSEI